MSLQIRIRYLYLYLYEVFNVLFFHHHIVMSGDGENRTLDPLLARQVLSQLSYAPIFTPSHCLTRSGGPNWTRTSDLALIRRAL